ncbi:probable calcium-binding protein CML45 isoform X4 [Ricinus communis]|uniref:probable calcium-binding protein CML45 isoform X4 n=1 Tax=Ricinus communis TaxID=3988 RepID=UPI0007721448|nr:probable calcium-binding protein CML45 isoform X4 [Ricinus communis]|eukprot:XP_015583498.1 probable calcium-binding protein CML30 isoform X2 [Ricinus communis]
MAKAELSDSELDEGEEEEESNVGKQQQQQQGISNYEKQRLSRIAENKARMEALGLHKISSSLIVSVHKSSHHQKSVQHKGRSKVVDDDDDYRPNDDDADDQDDDDDGDDFGDEDEDLVDQSSSKSRKNKAISLSLQESAKDAILKERKEIASNLEDAGRRKRKKSLNNRVQMTEDELVLHFFQFDEEGSGLLTVRDLQRLATAHDFTWTDRELADMIHLFDSDGDGKLNLNDFRKIAGRCNMIQGSENS